MKCVIGIGAGGHAKVVIDILRLMGTYEIATLLDSDKRLWNTQVLGVDVLGDDSLLPRLYEQGLRSAFIGVGTVGHSDARTRLYDKVCRHGFHLVSAIHPRSIVARSCAIGDGATIMAGAVLNADARVGHNVIINTGTVIEHDCVIGNHVHIAPGAVLSGNVTVEDGAHVGAGASIRQGVTIGRGALVGMGAVVVRDVPAGTAVAGVPAVSIPNKVLKSDD